ncbi:hypothetical protein Dimus_005031, partial [Dionaea muscipula]
ISVDDLSEYEDSVSSPDWGDSTSAPCGVGSKASPSVSMGDVSSEAPDGLPSLDSRLDPILSLTFGWPGGCTPHTNSHGELAAFIGSPPPWESDGGGGVGDDSPDPAAKELRRLSACRILRDPSEENDIAKGYIFVKFCSGCFLVGVSSRDPDMRSSLLRGHSSDSVGGKK